MSVHRPTPPGGAPPGVRTPGREATIGVGLRQVPDQVDLIVVGLGITGAGVALDAASRGLSVLAVDAHDLTFGTSRWSSKLVHGGLRYLAHGQVGVAHESAVERGLLMSRIAPHLVRPMPLLLPLTERVGRLQRGLLRAGLAAGDVLRRTSGTGDGALPDARRVSATEALVWAPGLRADGLRGALLSWDGQLEDDARLVVAVARTAAAYGAVVRTRARVLGATGTGVEMVDEITGARRRIRARAVANATGVWAAGLTESVRLRPSRGTHLVLRASALPGLTAALSVPLAGEHGRFALVLPGREGRVHVGLTDVPIDGPVPEVATASPDEVDFLLGVLADTFACAPGPDDVVGTFSGLRPLLESTSSPADGRTADLSRAHATVVDRTGLVTVVGGKLTTYRRMAEDAVDAACATAGLDAGPARTRDLPLLGAAPPTSSTGRLERRFGSEAGLVLEIAAEHTGWSADRLLEPIADGIPVTMAELVFGITHEGAHDVEDLLDRRTRVGLVAADRTRALPAAELALRLAARARVPSPVPRGV